MKIIYYQTITGIITVVLVSFESLMLTANANNRVPNGSYLNSCTHAYIDRAGNLNAVCKNRRGYWVETYLNNPRRCIGGINNINGDLECIEGPRGSYLESCVNIYSHQNTLYATCKNQRRRWQSSQLVNFNLCIGDIANFNGNLSCTKRY
ncbi:CVNH domain protein [Nostoc sp. PCC 7524]|uniref:CVNH domain-containing protein n=1 Tax=Nostoc sp. (strain ATCC 29411 / PCC 7524) TaxID=28072 RepID=UPI00029F4419|nr:CVNH domain-containing protein [Nostoc sp. PCC 7524]AFY48827.1 CVNH domain protein [Nostoc sp. PCC 7524]